MPITGEQNFANFAQLMQRSGAQLAGFALEVQKLKQVEDHFQQRLKLERETFDLQKKQFEEERRLWDLRRRDLELRLQTSERELKQRQTLEADLLDIFQKDTARKAVGEEGGEAANNAFMKALLKSDTASRVYFGIQQGMLQPEEIQSQIDLRRATAAYQTQQAAKMGFDMLTAAAPDLTEEEVKSFERTRDNFLDSRIRVRSRFGTFKSVEEVDAAFDARFKKLAESGRAPQAAITALASVGIFRDSDLDVFANISDKALREANPAVRNAMAGLRATAQEKLEALGPRREQAQRALDSLEQWQQQIVGLANEHTAVRAIVDKVRDVSHQKMYDSWIQARGAGDARPVSTAERVMNDTIEKSATVLSDVLNHKDVVTAFNSYAHQTQLKEDDLDALQVQLDKVLEGQDEQTRQFVEDTLFNAHPDYSRLASELVRLEKGE